MAPFLALQLSPGSYVNGGRWMENTYPVSLVIGVENGRATLSLGLFEGFYLYDAKWWPRTVSSSYRTLSITLSHRWKGYDPFASLVIAKPVVVGVEDERLREFNSSIRGTTYGIRLGIGRTFKNGILRLNPVIGTSYYPHLPVYEYDGRSVYAVEVLRYASLFVGMRVGVGF